SAAATYGERAIALAEKLPRDHATFHFAGKLVKQQPVVIQVENNNYIAKQQVTPGGQDDKDNRHRIEDENRRLDCYARLLRAEIQKRICSEQEIEIDHHTKNNVVPGGAGPDDAQLQPNSVKIVLELQHLSTTSEKLSPPRPTTTAAAYACNPEASTYDLLDESAEITISQNGAELRISARSCRGVLFGVGKFLRACVMGYEQTYQGKTVFAYFQVVPNKLQLQNDDRQKTEQQSSTTSTSSTLFLAPPKLKVRQHQIAYRPKTNAYDAFSPEQMRQQILDVALFGCNSIEVIPPGLDDAAYSPHFTTS
ncbi:unnamed protein product, partial [Amoebophrya sp. A120]